MSDNLDLWNSLRTPPPEFVSKIPGSSAKLSSIDPQWRVRRLTEAFGPYGLGWGTETLATGDGKPFTIIANEHYTSVFVTLRIWYMADGKRAETGWHTGGTTLQKFTRNGDPLPFDEVVKSSETDAFGKAASWIGLAADVYLGVFDGDKYLAEGVAKPSERPAPSQPSRGAQPGTQPAPSGGLRFDPKVRGSKRKDRVPLSSITHDLEHLTDCLSFHEWALAKKDPSDRYYKQDLEILDAIKAAVAALQSEQTRVANERPASTDTTEYYRNPNDAPF